jgi:hypothetical protein
MTVTPKMPVLQSPSLRLGRSRPRLRRLAALAAIGIGLFFGLAAPRAEDEVLQFDMVIKDHRFTPAEIRVPAGKRAVINLRNDDPTAEEFDSTALTIEKVIAGGRSGVIRLRPLEPGRYPFVGEYHAETAQGVVIVD